MHFWTQTNYGALLHSSMSTLDNTTQYHSGHRIKKKKKYSEISRPLGTAHWVSLVYTRWFVSLVATSDVTESKPLPLLLWASAQFEPGGHKCPCIEITCPSIYYLIDLSYQVGAGACPTRFICMYAPIYNNVVGTGQKRGIFVDIWGEI